MPGKELAAGLIGAEDSELSAEAAPEPWFRRQTVKT